jgi:hypothetical protein
VQAVYVPRFERAADYRRQAQDARAIANWITLNDARQQLVALSQHLEALAEIEEREARKTVPIQNPRPDR